MRTQDLVSSGHLTEDGWLHVPVRTRDGGVVLPRQALRVYGHAKRMSLPDGLGELCDPVLEVRPIYVDPDDAYAITTAMEAQWRGHNVFPFDTAQTPEAFNPVGLPVVVKRAMDRVVLPFTTREDLLTLVKLHQGQGEDLPEKGEARERRLREIRKQPVIRRLCRSTDCSELVTMSLRAAVISIKRYGLLPAAVLRELGLVAEGHNYSAHRSFRPHRLCPTCAGRRRYDDGVPSEPSEGTTRKRKSGYKWTPQLRDVTPLVTLPVAEEEGA